MSHDTNTRKTQPQFSDSSSPFQPPGVSGATAGQTHSTSREPHRELESGHAPGPSAGSVSIAHALLIAPNTTVRPEDLPPTKAWRSAAASAQQRDLLLASPTQPPCIEDELEVPAAEAGEEDITAAKRRSKRKELLDLQAKYRPEVRQLGPAIAYLLARMLEHHDSRPATPRHSAGTPTTGSLPTPSNASFTGISGAMATTKSWAEWDGKSDVPPPRQLFQFILMLGDSTFISPSALVGGLILVHRMAAFHQTLRITIRNVYKLYYVSVRVASKVLDLRTLTNEDFVRAMPGMTLAELNKLEANLLSALNWHIIFDPREFEAYREYLVQICNLYYTSLPPCTPSASSEVPSAANSTSTYPGLREQ